MQEVSGVKMEEYGNIIAIHDVGIPDDLKENIKESIPKYKNLVTGTYARDDGSVSLVFFFYDNLTDKEADDIVKFYIEDHMMK